jgi:DMSO/TMAO reductase YedYZ molybdopterin-dependent catalytic subunit
MALFIVRHQHDPDRCPAHDPYLGATLLNHLSRPNVRKYGITIQAEAVVRTEHTLYMIVESSDEACVRQYMQPFAMAGTLDVYPAATCAGVVSSGGCASPVLADGEVAAALDPEEACQQAIDDGLVVHRAHPLNCETSLPALIGGVVMPNARFYVRNHFQMPVFNLSSWRLEVRGLVDRPLTLGWRDLASLPSQTKVVTLECAGNGRSMLEPRVNGEQWNLGAVSTAEWTGVPLLEVLDRAGVQSNGRYIVFRGADRGRIDESSDPIWFERSLGIDDARSSEALLAYAMNGESLPIQHGHPLRLIVPGWYAVASVKWLTDIVVTDEPFCGHYQTGSYYFERQSDGQVTREPVSLQRVRSVITEPAADSEIDPGELTIRGVAWSGAAPIAKVELKVDSGSWQEARLIGERKRFSWQWWELITRIGDSGARVIRARATDMASRTQPEIPEWNRLGYGNNAIQSVPIKVR